MRLSMYLDDVVVWAPAKVNLFLEVLGKRPDGYHEIATLLAAIRLYDTLVFHKGDAPDISLTCSHKGLSTAADNLVMRAAQLLKEKTGCRAGADIRLVKRIPMAAGLAGGSTDAAATLIGLNRLWQLGLSTDQLASVGAELGSDIPFFFHLPTAWCTGRGERVTPMTLCQPLDLVLVCPSFGMATAAVYRNVTIPQVPESGDAIRQALAKGDVDLIGKLLHNRLQSAAEKLDPRIAQYDKILAEHRPAGHLMSGSGSTLYALCRSQEEAEHMSRRLADSMRSQSAGTDCTIIYTRSL